MPTVSLLSITPDYMQVLKAACSKPYGKEVTATGVKRIINSGHLSILEHCYATFEIKCSVRVLGQLTRHRHLSFTVKSARGSRFDTFVNPFTMCSVPLDDLSVGRAYGSALMDTDTNEEQAAYFLPQGAETTLVVTGNFRAWYEYLLKRLCKRAMPEHRELAKLIQEQLMLNAPAVFDHYMLHCNICTERSCVFKK